MTEPSGLRDLMSEQPSNDPFEECELSPDAILALTPSKTYSQTRRKHP